MGEISGPGQSSIGLVALDCRLDVEEPAWRFKGVFFP